ncbi:MAG: hypothetical protein A3H95_16010 [Acidobacteria bacterium RIFCSPLOWO2_02_FULL_64_15]|nr:MAG: hypothetical protein A3H95_16010 [Acidobacteria bacterium RIFCSPLOWO2_02_FULL_64_15]
MSDSQIILISGTSRGIGKYLAERYVESGATVIGCSRSPVVSESQGYEHLCADVSKHDEVKAMFAQIRRKYGRLDVLINSAAVNPAIALSALMPTAAIQSSFEVNLLGLMMMCREGVRLMARGRFGRIVNIGSMATRLEVAGESVYTAMKAGVNAYTRVLAKEVYKLGITCNVVAPSAVPTGLSTQVDPSALEEVLSRNAIPEMGTLRDISNVIDWLIRRESHAITGQIIYLGGV